MEKNGKIKSNNRVSSNDKALTKGVLISVFGDFKEDIKDLIESSVKRTETVLKKDIYDVRVRVDRTELAISEHTRLIKGLDTKVQVIDTRLQGLEVNVKGLGEEMHQMEKRLSDKIDGNSAKLENHETRICALETTHA